MVFGFQIYLLCRDRLRFVLRHLELTTDPDRPELFRKEKRKQVEHFLKSYLKVVLLLSFSPFSCLSEICSIYMQ